MLEELLESAYFAEPHYDDDVEEPQVSSGKIVFDRSGFPWTRWGDGWVAAGDSRIQLWPDVRKWF